MAITEAVHPLVLTLDVGTSAVRLLCFDAQARPITGIDARSSIEVYSDARGAAEIDIIALCIQCEDVIDTVIRQLGSHCQHVAAIAVDTMATTMVGIAPDGVPVGPLRTYADTQSAGEAHWLRQQYCEADYHDATGCLLRPNFWPARIRWLQAQRPHEWQAASMWMTLGEYLEWRWLGIRRVTPSVAAWTGLLDRTTLTWHPEWLAAVGMPAHALAPVVDVDVSHTGCAPLWVTRWPALAHMQWFPAIGDGAAANVGSGCSTPRHLALTVGTTGAMRIAILGTPAPPAGLWCYRIDRHMALVGGATSEGGNIYQWMRDTLQFGALDDAAIEAQLATYLPDSHGLTILPLWAGERSPGWAGDARATIHGMHLGTTPLDLLRAAFEAMALRFGQIAAELPVCEEVIASGGALLRSPTWLQICADVLGRPVTASAVVEATARGVALLALRSLGVIERLDDIATPLAATYQPDMPTHAVYQRAAQRQHALYALFYRGSVE
ncbi:MAG: carbohydrate kinase [Chloroflexia bacterium]|nr:carbohydrate kinase [Chloroflexia bacterium]